MFFNKVNELTSLFGENAPSFLSFLDKKLIEIYKIDISAVEKLISQRQQARNDKNFALSDQLRDQLNQMKIAVSDTSEGMHWEVMK